LSDGADIADGVDLFDLLAGRGGSQGKQRPKTKSMVSPLKVTLEQLYSGATRKMAVNRQVVDMREGITSCRRCNGQGTRLETIQLDGMIQNMRSTCNTCEGTGKQFKHRQDREVLEVHIQKGATDGQKIVFKEKADELPDTDTGDVVFVLTEQQHPEFKRRGADLFIEWKISLSEALCGFQLQVTHLDGRKLLIKSSPGEVVHPMPQGFDPLAGEQVQWECFEGFDCPDIETVARADETDTEKLKDVCERQLTRRGLEIGAFVVDERGAQFKQCRYAEAEAAKKPRVGSKLYVKADPMMAQKHRMMKAVKGEGMPTLKNPFEFGNLFLILTIEFPTSLPKDSLEALQTILPPPVNSTTVKQGDEGVEQHVLSDVDVQASHAANAMNMRATTEAYDEDDDLRRGTGFPGGQGAQCHQM